MRKAGLSILAVLLAACGKPSDKEIPLQTPAENSAPELRFFNTFSGITLYPDEPLVQKIYAYDPDGDQITFALICDPCIPGLELSEDGIFTWSPAEFDLGLPYSDYVEIEVSDVWGASVKSQLSVNIDQHIFRMGDNWSRDFVDTDLFWRLPTASQNLKYVIGFQHSGDPWRHRQGTVTYLGQFEGKHLILTARHLYESLRFNYQAVCDENRRFYFPILGFDTYCKSVLFTGEAEDFVILEIGFDQDALLESFSDHAPELVDYRNIPVETPLAVAGNGRHGNLYHQLTFGYDDDCIAFSQQAKDIRTRFNVFNPATGRDELRIVLNSGVMSTCDVSAGDSGGPLFERQSGKILGITIAGMVRQVPASSENIWNLVGVDENEKQLMSSHFYLPITLILEEIRNNTDLSEEQKRIFEHLSSGFEFF